ncbi:outer membrane lipoprotein-sorting protein [Aureitalea sp. L0-47]|uniref:outer membrane lipoprotein-sorting protein n=1 Tax=Aureitalea sp. L0-47 TaxID=2816962 RepID=UPI0022370C5B|nr:outer membrane lipoprotein-sorting protein [Aureitalea sp. L0-47]MCW5519476.1 outer membrane lipoprotein-sorting protein [Aureitalea sp. L0-47]
MKTIKTLFILLLIAAFVPANAQEVDEIIANYLENTGGAENWSSLEGIKLEGTVSAQGMSIPVEVYQTKDGKMLVKINIQGQEMTQVSFDGEKMWTTNFMTMQPEEADPDMTHNMKNQGKDFPDPFLDYKEKGYTVELIGEETMEGTETYKIKLTRLPILVDGVEEPNVTFYYFEKENFVPIATEAEIRQGPMKGQTMKDTQSDYQEVDGLYFPFATTMGGQPITWTNIVLNPEIDDTMFAMPEVAETEEKK